MKTKISKISLIAVAISSLSCGSNGTSTLPPVSGFKNERAVIIINFNSDAMEPFITKDDKYLFFNDNNGSNKNIYYAEKIDNTTFQFKGEIAGVNSPYVDANPTMDDQNNFCFISTRNLNTDTKTIYCGIFKNGTVTGIHQINGTININTPYWINMGVEISKDGAILLTSNARFNPGESYPVEGNIRLSVKNGTKFDIPDNEAEILSNINTDTAIEYAGELSSDKLEIFYSEVKLSNPPTFKLYFAKRTSANGVFEKPISIMEPFEDNPNAVVEAPTLSSDSKRLYYHKLVNDTYRIFMISR
ncbi:hypothetical protein [Desulfurobacterium sp.]